jgi:hypothetical protein
MMRLPSMPLGGGEGPRVLVDGAPSAAHHSRGLLPVGREARHLSGRVEMDLAAAVVQPIH